MLPLGGSAPREGAAWWCSCGSLVCAAWVLVLGCRGACWFLDASIMRECSQGGGAAWWCSCCSTFSAIDAEGAITGSPVRLTLVACSSQTGLQPLNYSSFTPSGASNFINHVSMLIAYPTYQVACSSATSSQPLKYHPLQPPSPVN